MKFINGRELKEEDLIMGGLNSKFEVADASKSQAVLPTLIRVAGNPQKSNSLS